MPTKFSKSQKKFIKGKKNNFEYEHDFIKLKTTQFLFDYVNGSNPKPKVRRKCICELQRRGIKLVWVKEPTKLDLSN